MSSTDNMYNRNTPMVYEIKITREMKERFQSEAVTSLNHFEKTLLTLEKNKSDTAAIHDAFRAVHSIKGNSDYLGIADINTLAHGLEDLMDALRNGSLPVVRPVLNVLFQGLDLLRAMNLRVTDEVYIPHDLTAIHHQINKIKALSREVLPPEDTPGCSRARRVETVRSRSRCSGKTATGFSRAGSRRGEAAEAAAGSPCP